MTFFNKKEEVLEIKLSSFGKQKLAAGKFKPVYYAFFDDDVLYDGARGGVVEDNNNIEPRIQENTPSLRVQTSFTDLEERIRKQTVDLGEDGIYSNTNLTNGINKDPTVFQDYNRLRNVLPLGNSQLGNQYVAAWNLKFLEGGYNKSRATTNDPTVTCTAPFKCQKPVLNIPQIDVDLSVQPRLVDKNFKGVTDPETGRYVALNQDTNQFIRLEKDYLLLELEEHNVDLLNDSFSLEVYEVIEDPNTLEEELKPKMFKKEIKQVVNGILLDREEIMAQISEVDVDDKFVEHFFTIMVDDKIDNKTKFDKILSRDKKGNIFDSNVGANEASQTPGSELYTSTNSGDEC